MSIVFFAGDKGGVGKSIACMAFIEWIFLKKLDYQLIEGDTSNDNVYKSYKNHIKSHQFNLGVSEGWRELMDLIEINNNINLVINTPARLDEIIKTEAEIFEEVCQELNQKIIIFWMINRQKDCVVSLKRALSLFQKSCFIVVKNLYFGTSNKFLIWDESEVKKNFDQKNGKTIEFPELNDRAVDKVLNARFSFYESLENSVTNSDKLDNQRIMISDKTDIQRWLRLTSNLFDSAQIG